jgi:uncharacterized protein with FMN-binding domain
MNKKIKVFAGLTGFTALGSVGLISHASATPQTFTGNVVADGPYGNIQVQITVDGGLITGITTPIQPTGPSASYASFAIPTLVTEALAAQSANINAVSGASYISSAWKSSLASAIANAGKAIGVQSPSPTPTIAAPTPVPTTTFTPVANVYGNTVCTTQSPTPVSTTSSTTTTTVSDTTPSTAPSNVPTPTTTPVAPNPSESESRSTPTPTNTFKSPEIGGSEGGADLVARTVTTSGNLTTTITITKVITQNQVVNCTTTNTVTNTVNIPVPGPTVYVNVPGTTVTVTPAPIETTVPPIVIGVPDHPVINKKPSPKPKIIIKKKTNYNPYNISVIKCQSGNYIKVVAGPNPSCPRGYIKAK